MVVPLEKLLDEKRVPILFIGAGISKRYLDACTWDALLESIALKIGVNKFQLNGIKRGLCDQYPGTNIYPALASELSKRMIDSISSGFLTRDDFPEMSDDDWMMMETNDPFKVTICNMLKDGELTSDLEKLNEIESFRKISDKIPAVITTNYDTFLETHIFKDFKVMVYPDDYYFSGSDGYGELLKIHGTVDNPDSIIITDRDYSKLNEESKVILSRLTYYMCYHPIIFLGYSLSDEEIHGLIYDLVSSLKQVDIDTIKNRLIRVSIADSVTKTTWISKSIEYSGKRIEVIDLEMPSPVILFDYLDKFTPVATPLEIRKYKSMIRDIVLSADPLSKRVMLINENSLNELDGSVVAFGDAESITSMMKGISGYDIGDVVLDVLTSHKGLLDSSKTAFIYWLGQKRICKGDKYIPLFHYYMKYNIDYKTLNRDIVEFTDKMILNMESKISKISGKCSSVLCSADIDSFLENQVKSFSRPEAIMYFQSRGIIDSYESRKRLESFHKANCEKGLCSIKSDLRCAISYLDYYEYRNSRAEPRTLSH